jgi:hypothetical protein
MERSGQAFLLPADAQVSNDVDLLEQTAINVAQVKERIRKSGVNGLYVNEAQGKIEAIDTNDGRVLAIERINGVRGFGNTQEQAKEDTLKNVGEGISESFIKLVAENAR